MNLLPPLLPLVVAACSGTIVGGGAGGGGNGGNAGAGGTATVEDACAAWEAARCAAELTCSQYYFAQSYPSLPVCEQAWTTICLQAFPGLPGLSFDWEEMRKLSVENQVSCPDLWPRLPAGTLPDGALCDLDWQCASGLCS